MTFLVPFFETEGTGSALFTIEAEDLTGVDTDLSVLLRSFVRLMRAAGGG